MAVTRLRVLVRVNIQDDEPIDPMEDVEVNPTNPPDCVNWVNIEEVILKGPDYTVLYKWFPIEIVKP